MLRLFLAWWLRQLAGLLPPAWRGGLSTADREDSVLLTVAPGAPTVLEAARRRGRKTLQLGRFGTDAAGLASLRAAIGGGRNGPVRLLLPQTALLEQHVSLPLAAERGLETALRWEMDRLTPFTADAVYWTWRLESRDRARGQLRLRLILVAKAAVAATVDTLAAAGLRATRLEAIGDSARAIPLTGPRAATARPVTMGLALLCLLLFAATLAAPFVRQERELDRLGTRIAALRPAVDQAEALRRRLAERSAGTDVAAAEAARVGDALHALAVLTDVLPDDTSLFELSLRDRVVTMTGQSSGAARLIPALAADPAIGNPIFTAPVTRNDLTGTETFSIRAELRP